MNNIQNSQQDMEIEIGLNESLKEDESDNNSDSSAYQLYQVLVERHDLYNPDPNDDDSSDEEEKFSSAEEQNSHDSFSREFYKTLRQKG